MVPSVRWNTLEQRSIGMSLTLLYPQWNLMKAFMSWFQSHLSKGTTKQSLWITNISLKPVLNFFDRSSWVIGPVLELGVRLICCSYNPLLFSFNHLARTPPVDSSSVLQSSGYKICFILSNTLFK